MAVFPSDLPLTGSDPWTKGGWMGPFPRFLATVSNFPFKTTTLFLPVKVVGVAVCPPRLQASVSYHDTPDLLSAHQTQRP